jgi:CheY-like chemotaxis protein
MLLEMHGHTVTVVHDGRQALSAIEASPPDVALLDIGMPGMSGYEVATELRTMHFGERVLIIAITGWGAPQDLERSRAAGIDLHLTKPADADALLRLVQSGRQAR